MVALIEHIDTVLGCRQYGTTAQGEVWRYANQDWKRHVPGYGAFARVEEQFVLFGADGLMIKTGTEDYGNAFQEPWRRAYGTN